MPTGAKHQKLTGDSANPGTYFAEDCRCMIGADHDAAEEFAFGDVLSEDDAEEIWRSSGMDEDYHFR